MDEKDRINEALRGKIDDYKSLLDLASKTEQRLVYTRAGAITDAYQHVVSDIAGDFGIDCVILATWDGKSKRWRNVCASAPTGEKLDGDSLLTEVLQDDRRDRLLSNGELESWNLGESVTLSGTLTIQHCIARSLLLSESQSDGEPRVAGLLLCLFSRPVEKAWQQIIGQLSMILARETYRFLRPYLGDRRIAEGNYDLRQFFHECERPATFLFADLRNFTAVTEALRVVQKDRQFQRRLEDRGHELSIQRLLKEYHTLMSRILRDNVRILEFTGDGVYAVFCNLLDENPDEDTRRRDCLKALCSAIQMKIAFRELRRQWSDQWMELYRREYNEELDLEMGIGINAGPATFTVFGAADYTRFSAIGDHVNFAARLCDKAARPDPQDPDRRIANILLSQTAYSLIKDYLQPGDGNRPRFQTRRMRFKGKSGLYPVHGLAGDDNELISAIETRDCQKQFKKDLHKHYFCDRQAGHGEGEEFICNCRFRGEAFDLPEGGKPILRLV